jgi:hypothetical protein
MAGGWPGAPGAGSTAAPTRAGTTGPPSPEKDRGRVEGANEPWKRVPGAPFLQVFWGEGLGMGPLSARAHLSEAHRKASAEHRSDRVNRSPSVSPITPVQRPDLVSALPHQHFQAGTVFFIQNQHSP